MIVALLVLIVSILLFGAGVIRGFLRNMFGAFLGIVLLAAFAFTIISMLGEEAFTWVWLGGGPVLFIAVLWARQYDPAEAEHRARVKRAQVQREERRKNGLEW